MEENLKLGETTKVFGIPVPDLSKEEMMAVIGSLSKDLSYERKMVMRSHEFYRAVLDRRSGEDY